MVWTSPDGTIKDVHAITHPSLEDEVLSRSHTPPCPLTPSLPGYLPCLAFFDLHFSLIQCSPFHRQPLFLGGDGPTLGLLTLLSPNYFSLTLHKSATRVDPRQPFWLWPAVPTACAWQRMPKRRGLVIQQELNSTCPKLLNSILLIETAFPWPRPWLGAYPARPTKITKGFNFRDGRGSSQFLWLRETERERLKRVHTKLPRSYLGIAASHS